MAANAVLLAIRPEYARLILSRQKTFELRRVCPLAPRGTRVILYASAPLSALVGTASVDSIVAASPRQLWPVVRPHCGITRWQFDLYFRRAKVGFGIKMCAAAEYNSPLSLRMLRHHLPDFRPPQNFRYVRNDRASDKRLLHYLP